MPSAVIQRRRLLALLAVAAMVAFIFGVASGHGDSPGPLRWAGAPRTGVAGDQQVLYGTLVNRARTPVRVRTTDVRVLDADGRRLTASAAFSGGYVASFGPARATVVAVRPGARLPLGVTWSGKGDRIAIGDSELAVPK